MVAFCVDFLFGADFFWAPCADVTPMNLSIRNDGRRLRIREVVLPPSKVAERFGFKIYDDIW